MLRLVSIAWESMSERRRIQFPRLESKCWTHVWELLLKLLFCHQLKPGRAFPKHFLNCAGSQWEAELSNRCEQHKSDHKTNEHTQGLIFLFIPAHSRRKCSETKAELSTEVLREELDIQARAARVCGVFFGVGVCVKRRRYRQPVKVSQQRMRCCGLIRWKSDTDCSWAPLPAHGRDPQKNSTRSSTGACNFVVLSPEKAAVVFSFKAKSSSESYPRQYILTQEALWKAPETIRQWGQFLSPSCRCTAKM